MYDFSYTPVTANEKLLFSIVQAIGNADPRLRSIYVAHAGLKLSRTKFSDAAVEHLTWQCQFCTGPDFEKAFSGRLDSIWIGQNMGEEVERFAKCNAAILALEELEDFPAAVELMAPLCAERDRLRLVIASEKLAYQEAEQAAHDAHAEAVRMAVEKAASDPLVISTRAKLAKLSEHPEAPVRGKIAIRSHVEPDPLA